MGTGKAHRHWPPSALGLDSTAPRMPVAVDDLWDRAWSGDVVFEALRWPLSTVCGGLSLRRFGGGLSDNHAWLIDTHSGYKAPA